MFPSLAASQTGDEGSKDGNNALQRTCYVRTVLRNLKEQFGPTHIDNGHENRSDGVHHCHDAAADGSKATFDLSSTVRLVRDQS